MSWPAHRRAALERALLDTQTTWGSSRWAAWRRCPRSHYLGYHVSLTRLGEQPPREMHFGVGSLCHAILRYMQEGVVAGEPEPRNWEDVLEFASDQPDSIPEQLDEAKRLMRFYWLKWGFDNAGWPPEAKIIGVEMHLETPPGFAMLPHTGRVDTLLDIGGTPVVVDTKTRGKALPEDEKLEEYKLDLRTRPQFLSLAAMLQMRDILDEPPAVLVNAIVKTKTPACGRVLVQLRQVDIDRWKEDHREAAAALVEEQGRVSAGYVPRRNLDMCAPEVGWGCKYKSYCHAASDEVRALEWKMPREPEAAE